MWVTSGQLSNNRDDTTLKFSGVHQVRALEIYHTSIQLSQCVHRTVRRAAHEHQPLPTPHRAALPRVPRAGLVHQQLQVRKRRTPAAPHEVAVAIIFCRVLIACVCLHRQGLLRLIELVRHPVIVITLEGQSKRMSPEVKQLLSEHQHRLTVLTWKHNSVVGPAASAHEPSRINRLTLSNTPHCFQEFFSEAP